MEIVFLVMSLKTSSLKHRIKRLLLDVYTKICQKMSSADEVIISFPASPFVNLIIDTVYPYSLTYLSI